MDFVVAPLALPSSAAVETGEGGPTEDEFDELRDKVVPEGSASSAFSELLRSLDSLRRALSRLCNLASLSSSMQCKRKKVGALVPPPPYGEH